VKPAKFGSSSPSTTLVTTILPSHSGSSGIFVLVTVISKTSSLLFSSVNTTTPLFSISTSYSSAWSPRFSTIVYVPAARPENVTFPSTSVTSLASISSCHNSIVKPAKFGSSSPSTTLVTTILPSHSSGGV